MIQESFFFCIRGRIAVAQLVNGPFRFKTLSVPRKTKGAAKPTDYIDSKIMFLG
jgi:hypothetical protein